MGSYHTRNILKVEGCFPPCPFDCVIVVAFTSDKKQNPVPELNRDIHLTPVKGV